MYIYLNHFAAHLKLIQHCKLTILQKQNNGSYALSTIMYQPVCIYYFNLHEKPMELVLSLPYLISEETEAHRG